MTVIHDGRPRQVEVRGKEWQKQHDDFRRLAELTGEWAGIPQPVEGFDVKLENRHRYASEFERILNERNHRIPADGEIKITCRNEDIFHVVNHWWSARRHAWVYLLRDEVGQREAELIADIEKQVADQWGDRDKELLAVQEYARELAVETNKKLREFVVANEDRKALAVDGFTTPNIRHRMEDAQHRNRLRVAAVADLKARVGSAINKLNRQEADLLKTLAVGSLESEEARRFLGEIPSVGELVPASRLKEIEASLGDDGGWP